MPSYPAPFHHPMPFCVVLSDLRWHWIGVTAKPCTLAPHLEQGPAAHVKNVFVKIRADRRHHKITLVKSRALEGRVRAFEHWNMQVIDFDRGDFEEVLPLREALHLLSSQFHNLPVWLPRLQHDILLSDVVVDPGAHTHCRLIAFAVHQAEQLDGIGVPVLSALAEFLSRGGEVVGLCGGDLVGYAFACSREVLFDEVADLCADFPVHVGVSEGAMLLLNAGSEPRHCDLGFYGGLFDRARGLARQAADLQVQILTDVELPLQVPGVLWQPYKNCFLGVIDTEDFLVSPQNLSFRSMAGLADSEGSPTTNGSFRYRARKGEVETPCSDPSCNTPTVCT